MKKVIVFLADGFEEMEAMGTVDVLRRGGIEVKTISIMENSFVTGAHNVQIKADAKLSLEALEKELSGYKAEYTEDYLKEVKDKWNKE